MSFCKKKIRQTRFFFRRATSSLRCQPDFIIIGAQKSGTTSLFQYLSQHPQVRPGFTKEVHFFDGGKVPGIDTYAMGVGWYKAHFPLKNRIDLRFITGEASPLYLFNPLAPQRIFNLLPRVKLIALLRNPAERALSHYYHEKKKGREPLPILEAFKSEDERIKEAINSQCYKKLNFINYSYLKRGLYAEQLERYFKVFNRSQILVINSGDFFKKPRLVLAGICRFLDIDDSFNFPDLTPKNPGKYKSPVEPEVKQFMDTYFREHNKRLFKLLGKQFDWE